MEENYTVDPSDTLAITNLNMIICAHALINCLPI